MYITTKDHDPGSPGLYQGFIMKEISAAQQTWKVRGFWTILLFSACVFSSCREEGTVQQQPEEPFALKLPSNFPAPVYDLSKNPVTKEGFALGKMLFYDPVLSRDSSISCASCHDQYASFTQHGHDVSHGIDDKLGTRNSLPIMNVLWQQTFFWDGGVHNLDLVPINAISSPVEMDESPAHVLEKLRRNPKYPALFQSAFGSPEITSQNFFKALSQFMAMLVSANSKYDKYVRGEGVSLSIEELQGLQLFEQKCSSCHSTDLFTDGSFRNNGIKNNFSKDPGRYLVTLNPADSGKFRVPSLRNIIQTAPYMHDGKFYDLKSVLDHYSGGVKNSSTLDPLLKQDGRLGIALSEDDKNKIIAFLGTLTDTEFLRDKRFSE
jgi:cytochrome c peroxidase